MRGDEMQRQVSKNVEKNFCFIFVILGFMQSRSDILLLAAFSRMQNTEAEVKPEAKLPMGRGRVRVREKEKARRRGSERQKGGQHWEKT